jgi:hypothetical protein
MALLEFEACPHDNEASENAKQSSANAKRLKLRFIFLILLDFVNG